MTEVEALQEIVRHIRHTEFFLCLAVAAYIIDRFAS